MESIFSSSITCFVTPLTAKIIYFCLISCKVTILKDAKLHLNEKVLSETEILKDFKSFVAASNPFVKLTFFSAF